jgi:hypothetical protein
MNRFEDTSLETDTSMLAPGDAGVDPTGTVALLFDRPLTHAVIEANHDLHDDLRDERRDEQLDERRDERLDERRDQQLVMLEAMVIESVDGASATVVVTDDRQGVRPAAQPLVAPLPTAKRWRLRGHSLLRWGNTAMITSIAAAAFFANEFRSQDWDPMYMRDIVERQMRFGGSFYINGIHNKGPLEPVIYRLAAAFTSYGSYWYAISAFVLISALTLGFAAARVTRSISGDRALGAAVAMAVVVHFTLSGADYAGVLYSRNMTVTALAVSFAMLVDTNLWRGKRRLSPRTAAVIIGVLFGATMQTLTTAVLSVSVLGVAAWWMMGEGEELGEQKRRFLTMGVTAAATFALAPAYYIARGMGGVFWRSWWVYGTYMTRSTGRSLASQLSLGWTNFYAYYQTRPLAALVIAVFVLVTWLHRQDASVRMRAMHFALIGWWFAGCLEITLTQRYSSHYFSVTTVPTVMMGAALFGHALFFASAADRRRWATAGLTASMFGTIFFSNPVSYVNGLQSVSSFRGFGPAFQAREQSASGPTQTARAILDLVSRPGDPLLMWTNAPWSYLSYHRVSATRFIWKSFLMGEIYLGRTSKDWVLPGSWDQWRSDMAQANPEAFVLEKDTKLDPDTPAADYIAKNFETIYTDDNVRVDLRRQVAQKLLNASGFDARPWNGGGVPSDSGWTITDGTATYSTAGRPASSDRLLVSPSLCFRLDGEIDASGAPREGLAFRFEDPSAKHERRNLIVSDGEVAAGSDNVSFGSSPLTTPITESLTFSLIVGRDSAALVTEGHVAAALRLQGPDQIFAEAKGATSALRNLRLSPAPANSGC